MSEEVVARKEFVEVKISKPEQKYKIRNRFTRSRPELTARAQRFSHFEDAKKRGRTKTKIRLWLIRRRFDEIPAKEKSLG